MKVAKNSDTDNILKFHIKVDRKIDKALWPDQFRVIKTGVGTEIATYKQRYPQCEVHYSFELKVEFTKDQFKDLASLIGTGSLLIERGEKKSQGRLCDLIRYLPSLTSVLLGLNLPYEKFIPALPKPTKLQLINTEFNKSFHEDPMLEKMRALFSVIPEHVWLEIRPDCSDNMFKAQLSTLKSGKRVILPSKLTPEQCTWLVQYGQSGTDYYCPPGIETETAVNVLKALKENQRLTLSRNTSGRLIYELLTALTPNERGCTLVFCFPREGLYPHLVNDRSDCLFKSSDSVWIDEDLNPDLLAPLFTGERPLRNILLGNDVTAQTAVDIVSKIKDNPFVTTFFLALHLSDAWIRELTSAIFAQKFSCSLSFPSKADAHWIKKIMPLIPAKCQLMLPKRIGKKEAITVVKHLPKDAMLFIQDDTPRETVDAILQYIQTHKKSTRLSNIKLVQQNKRRNVSTPPPNEPEESLGDELLAAELIDILDSRPLSGPASETSWIDPLADGDAPAPQTQRLSSPSSDPLLVDSSWLYPTEIPPVTEAPPHSPPSAIVSLSSHMFSRAPKVSEEESVANEGFKALIESKQERSIFDLPETFSFPSPRFIEKTLKKRKGIIKLHPKTDLALATWIVSALPPNVALMLPPELIAVPETAKGIVDVLKPECTLYVDAFSPELTEIIQILPPKVTLLLNMNKLGLPEARSLVSALPSACHLALVISRRTHFTMLRDRLPELINSLKAGCTLKVDMAWKLEDVLWLASRLSPGIGLSVPPRISQAALDRLISDLPASLTLSLPKSGIHLTSSQWRELLTKRGVHIAGAVFMPSDLLPIEIKAITSKLVPGTVVTTQATDPAILLNIASALPAGVIFERGSTVALIAPALKSGCILSLPSSISPGSLINITPSIPKGVVLTLSHWHNDLLSAIQRLAPGARLALSPVWVAEMKGRASIDFPEVLTAICHALPSDCTLIVEKEERKGCGSRVLPDATAHPNIAPPSDCTLIVEKEERMGCSSQVSPDATAHSNISPRSTFFSNLAPKIAEKHREFEAILSKLAPEIAQERSESEPMTASAISAQSGKTSVLLRLSESLLPSNPPFAKAKSSQSLWVITPAPKCSSSSSSSSSNNLSDDDYEDNFTPRYTPLHF